jgi:hypothetical protein
VTIYYNINTIYMDLYHIHSVIKHKYEGVTEDRKAPPVDREGPYFAVYVSVGGLSEGSLSCLMPPVLQNRAVRLQHYMVSSFNRTAPFPVRTTVAQPLQISIKPNQTGSSSSCCCCFWVIAKPDLALPTVQEAEYSSSKKVIEIA